MLLIEMILIRIVVFMKYFIFILFLISHLLITAQEGYSIEQLKKHVAFLSSDSLEGRLTGSSGETLAANYHH